jgi:hypothetical protein
VAGLEFCSNIVFFSEILHQLDAVKSLVKGKISRQNFKVPIAKYDFYTE